MTGNPSVKSCVCSPATLSTEGFFKNPLRKFVVVRFCRKSEKLEFRSSGSRSFGAGSVGPPRFGGRRQWAQPLDTEPERTAPSQRPNRTEPNTEPNRTEPNTRPNRALSSGDGSPRRLPGSLVGSPTWSVLRVTSDTLFLAEMGLPPTKLPPAFPGGCAPATNGRKGGREATGGDGR